MHFISHLYQHLCVLELVIYNKCSLKMRQMFIMIKTGCEQGEHFKKHFSRIKKSNDCTGLNGIYNVWLSTTHVCAQVRVLLNTAYIRCLWGFQGPLTYDPPLVDSYAEAHTQASWWLWGNGPRGTLRRAAFLFSLSQKKIQSSRLNSSSLSSSLAGSEDGGLRRPRGSRPPAR